MRQQAVRSTLGDLTTYEQLWKGNSGNFTDFSFVHGLAYDFGVCISSQDIIASRVQNHPCTSRLNTYDWAISGVGTVCIVVGL
jgi:hypothetical protein